MKNQNYIKGKKGEKIAANYLKLRLYKILEMNYKFGSNEIDIVAKKGNVIIFVEVKYRLNLETGYPREAVNKPKQEKIRRAAEGYISVHNTDNMDFRFDVIEIVNKKIVHIKNAF